MEWKQFVHETAVSGLELIHGWIQAGLALCANAFFKQLFLLGFVLSRATAVIIPLSYKKMSLG